MNDSRPGAAVVVGIDGSHAAVEAAVWAIDEAVARHVPLRLVHVADPESSVSRSAGEVPLGVEYGETVLRQAHTAITRSGKDVKVETVVVGGDPAQILLAESRTAELVCVGSSGIGAVAKTLLGSVAATLTENASCPVAVIRSCDDGRRSVGAAIAVAVRASPQDEAAVVAAMQEARVRGSSLLAIGLWEEGTDLLPHEELDELVQTWRQRYPDICVQPVTTRSGLARFLEDEDAPVAMVVINAEDASRVADIIGPRGHPIFKHPACSVLVVRH
ncbi:universal stress protein [Mycobacterium hackensackense]|uniref:universal stress protein n=1 Tax=Mycobacterium hackensackense TaxID=228909 RepID=UPI00226580BE|nr:universal stress protein [Mycobacterium hackensackense]MCV7250863.1 universal stress protein [Mycobacterium hackensackense]